MDDEEEQAKRAKEEQYLREHKRTLAYMARYCAVLSFSSEVSPRVGTPLRACWTLLESAEHLIS